MNTQLSHLHVPDTDSLQGSRIMPTVYRFGLFLIWHCAQTFRGNRIKTIHFAYDLSKYSLSHVFPLKN